MVAGMVKKERVWAALANARRSRAHNRPYYPARDIRMGKGREDTGKAVETLLARVAPVGGPGGTDRRRATVEVLTLRATSGKRLSSSFLSKVSI
jgi:hypothetical protein